MSYIMGFLDGSISGDCMCEGCYLNQVRNVKEFKGDGVNLARAEIREILTNSCVFMNDVL